MGNLQLYKYVSKVVIMSIFHKYISQIQKQTMRIEARNQFKRQLQQLLETYEVVNNIFCYQNFSLQQPTSGYFEESFVSSSLDAVLDGIDLLNNGAVRYSNFEGTVKYYGGILKDKLSDCDMSKTIIDCSTNQYLHNL